MPQGALAGARRRGYSGIRAPMPLALALLLLVLAIPAVVALMRANELFMLRIHAGKLRVSRGRIPQALLNELGDAVRDPPLEQGSLRGVVEDRRVRIYPEGELTEAQKQRIRNVIAAWPPARVRSAPRSR
jgi:Protein of unknown function (DUF3634)